MPSDNLITRLQESTEFKRLVRRRLRVCFILSLLMVVFYSCFYFCMAFLPEFMGSRLFDSSVISIGVYFGITSMLLAVVLSGIYFWWSSNRFEPLKEKILKTLQDENQQQ